MILIKSYRHTTLKDLKSTFHWIPTLQLIYKITRHQDFFYQPILQSYILIKFVKNF